jgi:hypothetical protein
MADVNQVHYDILKTMFPELKNDPVAQAHANVAHQYAVTQGVPIGSEQHYRMIKAAVGRGLDQLGDVDAIPADRLPRLTPAEKAAARDFLSGDEKTYAREKVRLLQLKQAGYYSRERG